MSFLARWRARRGFEPQIQLDRTHGRLRRDVGRPACLTFCPTSGIYLIRRLPGLVTGASRGRGSGGFACRGAIAGGSFPALATPRLIQDQELTVAARWAPSGTSVPRDSGNIMVQRSPLSSDKAVPHYNLLTGLSSIKDQRRYSHEESHGCA
jgi:hypothetical protein